MLFVYNCLLLVVRFGYAVAGLFSAKPKAFNEGRSRFFERLKSQLATNAAPIIWVHCASLGEFEQGRPVIEKLKQEMR